jgi:hypothetical protein
MSNKMHDWSVCLSLLVLSLLLATPFQQVKAQDGTHTPSPTPQQGGTATPAPTLTPESTFTPTPTPLTDIPSDFYLLDAALGVQLFRKDYANGSPDFVQVIDLSQGARVELLHGEITEARPEKGSFGGPDPRMTSPALTTFWSQITSRENNAFCVTNGAFFYMPEYPTRLSFPLKVNGQVITEGWGIDTYVGEHLMLELWPEQADIQDLSAEALHDSQAPDILGGLTEMANKRAKFAVGRTFVGVDDPDGDRQYEILLILNTQTAVQSGAAQVLRDFGADKVMMLDGGGSTQLLCRGGYFINSDRPIPQALAIIAAEKPLVSAELLGQPTWPVLVEGEAFPFEMEIRNTGVITWAKQTTQIELDPGSLGMPRWLSLDQPVEPGQQAVFSDTLTGRYRPGVYPIQIDWNIVHKDKDYPGQSIETWAVVLPEALAGQRGELEQALQSWQSLPPAQIQAQAEAWLEQRSATQTPALEAAETALPVIADGSIRPLDAILVPLLMLPIVVLLGFILSRKSAER